VENSEAVEFGLNEASVGQSEASDPSPVQVRSLKELLDRITGRGITTQQLAEESGLAEVLPFPFLALVGQHEMKLALLLSLINPLVGGVLLIGPRGTGKTTAVRSLADLLPEVPRSLCYYGCLPEDIESKTDHIVHVCAGSGSVPSFAILKHSLVTQQKLRHTFIYSNRTWDDVIFRDQMNALAAAHPDRFTLVHTLTREPNAAALGHDVRSGRVSEELIAEFVPQPSECRFFVCGPAISAWDRSAAKEKGIEPQPRFMESVLTSLRALGVNKNQFTRESFG